MSTTTKPIQSDDHTEAMTDAPTVAEKSDEISQDELLVHVMHDQLDVMLAIIMKIREDPEYASQIYSDCPRLQHILDQHPDLRPVFEDAKFIRINFEQVYKKAGGVLPEDKPNHMLKILRCIVNHPLFKVLKVLLFIKKIVSCIFGGGIGFITAMCFPSINSEAAASAAAAAAEANEIPEEGSPVNQENRESLYHAAEYMEQEEVQAKMQALIESNPENLDEVIEQDPELRALRDSNPLCAEMMKDPEMMKILVDPDNLRTLAECPDIIEKDFDDPNWTPPEIQQGTFDETAIATPTEGTEVLFPAEDGVPDDELPIEEEDEEEMELPEVEAAEDDRNAGMQKAKSGRSMNTSRSNMSSKGSSYFASFKDYVAAEIVGNSADSMLGLDAVDTSAVDQAADAADAAEANASNLESVTEMAGKVEDTMDKIEETHEDKLAESTASTAAIVGTSTVAGGAIGAAAATAATRDNEDDPETPTSARSHLRKGVGSMFSSFHAAAKEKLATTLLGDELGEHLLEKMEENEEAEDDDDENEGKGKRSGMQRLGSIL